jgi:hypothetical protein
MCYAKLFLTIEFVSHCFQDGSQLACEGDRPCSFRYCAIAPLLHIWLGTQPSGRLPDSRVTVSPWIVLPNTSAAISQKSSELETPKACGFVVKCEGMGTARPGS